MSDLNRDIFETKNQIFGLSHQIGITNYDRELVEIRRSLIKEYIKNDSYYLDIGCGSGSYLLYPMSFLGRGGVGLDFSFGMLKSIKLEGLLDGGVFLVQGDAQMIPFPNKTFDLIYSYCTLYYIRDIEKVITEISRVLKADGIAILEVGNSRSLNYYVNMQFHKMLGWAKPFFSNMSKLKKTIRNSNLEIINIRSFQLLPMYGTPPGMNYFSIFTSPKLKLFFGLKIYGKMIDEWISSIFFLRWLSFRHILVIKKC